ncbi:cation:proton antiporter [Methanohalophilus sp.]|uniref:cation:proton antiporter n=1 Tax=Methanohalophilus sp. TaxID=1966352 RepID=UPI00261DCEAF|nr:cation:proton antiporter [Methanohalophilus sp.]
MINIFLFLSIAFLLTFVIGRQIEKIKVPWIFAALLLGVLLAIYNPVTSITSSEIFIFFAKLGMYFLLFMIGLEIDLKEMKKKGRFIIKATFFIIFLEAISGSLLVHFIFGNNWFISFLVAMSFATVGEAILIPILDEFKLINTDLGQAIIGIGTLDDTIEILALILVTFLVGSSVQVHFDISLIIISLFILFILTIGFTKLKQQGNKFDFLNVEITFLFTIFVVFLFLGIGEYAEAAPLAALLAGIGIGNFLPEKRLKLIDSEVKTMCYGFFAPIFFLWVGATLDMDYLVSYPLLVLLVVAVSNGSKLLGSYIVARDELGIKKSILLGIGLSVRFSTSIIIIKILFENGLIGSDLYSVIIASSIAFKFIVPVLFSNLIDRWKIAKLG